MNKGIVLLLAVLAFSMSSHAKSTKMFKVTIINLTKGQPMTPPVVAIHAPDHTLVHLGQPASEGLSLLATDGMTDKLVSELNAEMKVVRSSVGGGVILPGQNAEIIVEANNPYFKITVLSMLARTNDAIAVAQGISTHLKVGEKNITLASIYDAGVETNTESCDHIPAPPCGNPGVATATSEGFIRPHEGLLGIADLTLQRDAFAGKVAKIIVERVQ